MTGMLLLKYFSMTAMPGNRISEYPRLPGYRPLPIPGYVRRVCPGIPPPNTQVCRVWSGFTTQNTWVWWGSSGVTTPNTRVGWVRPPSNIRTWYLPYHDGPWKVCRTRLS